MTDVDHIRRLARALHEKAQRECNDLTLETVEMIVCDAHLIFVDGMAVERWEGEDEPYVAGRRTGSLVELDLPEPERIVCQTFGCDDTATWEVRNRRGESLKVCDPHKTRLMTNLVGPIARRL